MGLRNNEQKTKVMRINAKNHDKIKVEGQDIEDADEFMYLGETACKEGGMKELKNRISKPRSAFVLLRKIWRSSGISRTKL